MRGGKQIYYERTTPLPNTLSRGSVRAIVPLLSARRLGGYAIGIQDRRKRDLGADVLFMDIDSIPLGKNFVKIYEVAKCAILLAVIGPNWFDCSN